MKRFLAAVALGAGLLAAPAALAQNEQNQMPDPATLTTPRVVLVRVYVTDLERSERFYREVFGLTSPQDYGGRERVYTLDPNGARFVLMLTPTARPNGSFAMAVPDIDAVMSRTPAAGGTVTRAPGPPSAGGYRIGFVTDPDGASIEVIQIGAP